MKPAFYQKLRIGVLGGGQLGRMLLPPAQRFGVHMGFLDPDPAAPVASLGAPLTRGDFRSAEDVLRFGRQHDLVTLEIENVSTEALAQLVAEGIEVYPQPQVVALIQDKGAQKEFYTQHGIPTAAYRLVSGIAELREHPPTYPSILKLCRGGYDGRGVIKLTELADLDRAAAKGFYAPCVLEALVPIRQEIAVIVARNVHGQVVAYPPVEMAFHPTAHLVEYLYAPAHLDSKGIRGVQLAAVRVAEALGIVGLLAVELFIDEQGEVLVNEIAPRPHNSGHASIEANVTSQYEQHLRAILGLPLGSPALRTPAVMLNLLGEEGHSGPARIEGIEQALAQPGVHFHWYGKAETRPLRKMGHVTITDASLEAAIQKAYLVRRLLRVVT